MLVLASQSPRRRQLLEQLGVPFRVEAANVDETPRPGESPASMTSRLAALKARTVFDRLGGGDPVLGGDTTVALDDEIFGKPADREEALCMLQRLSGKTHTVYSAVVLVTPGLTRQQLSATRVTFDAVPAVELENYCDSREPIDKAGGYGIQGAAGKFVRHIEGSYSGVVGLPLWETWQLLRSLESG